MIAAILPLQTLASPQYLLLIGMSPTSMTEDARESSKAGRTESPDAEEAVEAETLFLSAAEDDELLYAHVFFIEIHLTYDAVVDWPCKSCIACAVNRAELHFLFF